MRDWRRWSTFLSIFGGLAVLVGSLDPMEGSLAILPGTGLLALGGYMGREDRRAIAYRTWSFVLVALGVGALFGFSAIGGLGGTSGHSIWWALLILPYVIGWSIGLWGPGAPRWLSIGGIVIGAWYLAILAMMLWRRASAPDARPIVPAVLIGIIGVTTIAACVWRLSKTTPRASGDSNS